MNLCWSVCLAMLLTVAAPVLAAPPVGLDAGQPVEIAADRLEADDVAKTLVFIGHAMAKQGDITITGERLTIHYAGQTHGGDVERIVAEGDVRIVQGERIATGGKAEFFRGEERIVLTGSPRVREGRNSVEGNEITLFLKESRSVVKGGRDGRVNAVFQPKGGEAR